MRHVNLHLRNNDIETLKNQNPKKKTYYSYLLLLPLYIYFYYYYYFPFTIINNVYHYYYYRKTSVPKDEDIFIAIKFSHYPKSNTILQTINTKIQDQSVKIIYIVSHLEYDINFFRKA